MFVERRIGVNSLTLINPLLCYVVILLLGFRFSGTFYLWFLVIERNELGRN